MIANYHTHTVRCHHADKVEDAAFVEAAIGAGLKVLGFSEHAPWPYETDTWEKGARMNNAQFEEYVSSVRRLQKQYEGKIRIYLGLECEYYPKYLPWLGSVRDQLDYVILGNHWPETDEFGAKYMYYSTTPEELERYTKIQVEAMESGLFCYAAHPDFGFSSWQKADEVFETCARTICKAAKRLEMPLEYNLYGAEKRERRGHPGLGYPCAEFWEIAAEEGCDAVIGYDAHYLRHLQNTKYRDGAEKFLHGLGLNVLETLPGLE